MEHDECRLFYLKSALEGNPKDPHLNKLAAIALTDMGQFDQAIACWRRVEQARPNDEEPQKAIADLAVRKTIAQGGYDDGDPSKRLHQAGGAGQQAPVDELTPEQRLEEKIAKQPKEIAHYYELAQYYANRDRFEEAEEVLVRAVEASDGDRDVRERLEDIQEQRLRRQASQAKGRVEEDSSEENERLYRQARKELNTKEIEVYGNRCERYPNNLAFKYELGVRYQLAGEYGEAIKQFQIARNDPRRKGLCMLALGQCFQQIKQFKLAMTNYEGAIEEIPDRDAANKRDALHRAGKMALALKDIDTAEKHLTALAGQDFTYKDVSSLLDRITEMRDNEQSSPAE
jgi:tetratricopeptide (TPR) repeat protein